MQRITSKTSTTMAKEEKLLLFKDLSARLPYHVRVKVWLKDGTTEEGALDLEHNYGDVLRDAFYYKEIVDIKPYLRPMSSMTKDEYKEMQMVLGGGEYAALMNKTLGLELWLESVDTDPTIWFDSLVDVQDWLNAHHFDYRGLIEKGLALEAPEDMYNLNKE